MKRISHILMAVLAFWGIVTMASSCQEMIESYYRAFLMEDWSAEYDMLGKTGLKQDIPYDHVVEHYWFSDEGFGYFERFLFEDGKLVGIPYSRNDNGAFTYSLTDKATMTIRLNKTGESWTIHVDTNNDEFVAGGRTFKLAPLELIEQMNAWTVQTILVVLPNEISVAGDTTGSFDVEVKANVEYDIIMPKDASWLKLIDTKDTQTDKHVFSVEKNETYDDRFANVLFKSKTGNVTDTLFVTQRQANALILSQTEYSLNNDAQDISVKIRSNIDYMIEIPGVVDWISVVKTKALKENDIIFHIADNPSKIIRSSVIYFKTDNPQIKDSLVIEQGADGIVPIPDANFKAYCVQNFDTNQDGEISFKEAKIPENINCNGKNISSLSGIEFFTNAFLLDCHYNNLSTLDVSSLSKLQYLYCSENQLTELDVSHNLSIGLLDCSYNSIASLNIGDGSLQYLQVLYCNDNKISSLNVSNYPLIYDLRCSSNQLTALDVSKNTRLSRLYCGRNKLSTLDVSANTALTALYCGENPLTTINISKQVNLIELGCAEGQLTNLDLSNNKKLSTLRCNNNLLTELNVSENTALKYLDCSSNHLVNLNFSNNKELTQVNCSYNDLSSLVVNGLLKMHELECNSNNLTSLVISDNISLELLWCMSNSLSSLDISQNSKLTEILCSENQLTTLNTSSNSLLRTIWCTDNLLESIDVSDNLLLTTLICSSNPEGLKIYIKQGQVFESFYHDETAQIIEKGSPIPEGNITFTDDAFKSFCVEAFDYNNDGEVSYAEAVPVIEIKCPSRNISSLSGIEYFPNLKSLNCRNNQLTSLVLHSNNRLLTDIDCGNNNLSTLDVSANDGIINLFCDKNNLSSIDVSNCKSLVLLHCGNNQITNLDISKNKALTQLECQNNKISSLDVSNNVLLTVLFCYNNQLASLDVSKNNSIQWLECNNNNLTSLIIGNQYSIGEVECANNQLSELDISGCNANTLWSVDCINNKEGMTIWYKSGQPEWFIFCDESATIKYK